jgi:hypothetical protein
LFGVEGRARPQYFAYQFLGRLGERRIEATSSEKTVRVRAGKGGEVPAVMIVNGGPEAGADRIVNVRFANLAAGGRRLVVRRIDRDLAWSERELEVRPVERREVDVGENFACGVYCPAESVTLVTLEPLKK